MIRKFCDRVSLRACAIGVLLGAAGMSLASAAAEPTMAGTNEPAALKIGLLLDLSSGSAEVYRDRQRAFELAIKHVNEAGGVLGSPVTVAVGDATADPERAVAAARRLVEVEGVHAIVGPNASASALPVLAYVKEAYDATVALALAAQAAGRLDGALIRERLRAVGSAPGTVVHAGPSGVADGLRVLANGGEIDYEGASGSMDWDGNGDLRRGHIGIWRFTEDERIQEIRAVAFEE